MGPRELMTLITHIEERCKGAQVTGLLYELPRQKSLSNRLRDIIGNFHRFAYLKYFGWRLRGLAVAAMSSLGGIILRFFHADTQSTTESETIPSRTCDTRALIGFCALRNISLHLTLDFHDSGSLQFTRELQCDLGVVFGTRILQRALFEIPADGSINIHKRQVPEYRGGGPIGLWELLDGRQELGVTVHRVTDKVDAGAILAEARIPIEEFDTLTSLALKADVVGNDLLVQAIAELAEGTPVEKPQPRTGRTYRNPRPEDLLAYERKIAANRRPYRPVRGRAAWKLLLRVIMLFPFVLVRNWYRRLSGTFPVVVLCHHLVSDRPHRLGIPLESYLRHVRFLQKHYQVVSLPEAIRLLRSGRVTRPTVALTLDDGYADNAVSLRAIQEATGVPITLFVCSQKIAQQAEFDHDIKWGLRNFAPLTWNQVHTLDRQGIQIASHTRTHFDCGSTELESLRAEIAGSKDDLQQQLGESVEFFAFPWGKPENMSRAALEIASETYEYVFSAFGGVNFPSSSGRNWHFQRILHPNDLWELELAVQSILDFDSPRQPLLMEEISCSMCS
jgi:peptidoglycan/xylan/chitin deacetylase (PgdA/CDA1 family)